MTDKTYNGWTNYPTWRVNLEIFDGSTVEDILGYVPSDVDTYQLSQSLKEYAEELVTMDAGDGLAKDYALSFLSEVDFYSIAEHLISDMENN